MEKLDLRLVSGELIFSGLSSSLNEKTFAMKKAIVWLEMLQEFQRPVKWFKTSKKGTRVRFDYIREESEFEQGMEELEAFIVESNEKFGTTFRIKKTEE